MEPCIHDPIRGGYAERDSLPMCLAAHGKEASPSSRRCPPAHRAGGLDGSSPCLHIRKTVIPNGITVFLNEFDNNDTVS